MWEFFQENPFVVGALSGGLAAYVLRLIVEHLRREKKTLGYSVTSRKIAERIPREDFIIKFQDRDIENLHSHNVSFRNTGNTALKDFRVEISCEDGQFVEHEVRCPAGEDFQARMDHNQQKLTIDCTLLNRGEHFTAGLTAINSNTDTVSVVARAENLKANEMADYRYSNWLILLEKMGVIWLDHEGRD